MDLMARTYVRVGSTNRRADRNMREEMRRYARGESYDEQPIPDLSLETLDFSVASELFSGIRALKTKDMVCGKERLDRFPDAWFQVGRFRGVNKAPCTDLGLPEPRFEEIGMRFRVTFVLNPIEPPKMDDIAQGILQALQNKNGLSTKELAEAIDLTPRATRLRLIRLVGQGLVRESGSSIQDPTKRYFLAAFRKICVAKP
jgi:predicted HTH transcriptional regulator